MSSIIGAVEFVDKGHSRVIKMRPVVIAVRQAILYIGEMWRWNKTREAHLANRANQSSTCTNG